MSTFSIRSLDRRIKFVAVATALLLAAMVPAMVLGAQVTERSIELSSSSVTATNVTYTVNFTADAAAAAAGAFVVDFCSDSPVIGQECTPPAGFNATAAASTSAGVTAVTGSANKVIVTRAIAAGEDVSVALTGITNPSTAGALYARILTYADIAGANGYVSDDVDAVAAPIDQGGVAISITPTVGVSGAVLESLTFCVSGEEITVANCGSTTSPVLELGEQVGDTVALTPGVVSEGSIFTQISTNAASGVVVRLKSNATGCGGLLRAGAPEGTCDILPALATGIDPLANEAKFGVKTSAATTVGANPNGTLQPVADSNYNNATFALNFAENDVSGVTSTFGDPFLDTNGAPATNQNMELTFGATVSNNTPAGSYSADMRLIAVGKF